MVASQVELVSLSARPNSEAVRWSCDGSPNFSLEAAGAQRTGTDVILHLQEEELEYIEPARIRTLINTYCDFMPVEVQLEETVNKREAPWRKARGSSAMRTTSSCIATSTHSKAIPCSGFTSTPTTPTTCRASSISPSPPPPRRLGKGRDQALLQPGLCERLHQGGGAQISATPARGDRFTRYPAEREPLGAADRSPGALHWRLCGQEGGRPAEAAASR